jgi:hypothetical protein
MSDMFTAVSAGFQSASHVDRSGEAAGSPPRNGGRGDGSKDEMLTGWCSWYELMDKVYV